MANICDNDFRITFEDEETGKKIEEKLEKLFNETLDGEITYSDEGCFEGWFSSKWDFPEYIFEHFFEEFKDPTIYMRCLSIEWGCSYIALNIYEDGAWRDEQSFDF